jgi:ubiquitin conjugation factor E4 B
VAPRLRLLTASTALLAALCGGGGPAAALLAGPLMRARLAGALAAGIAKLAGPSGVELKLPEQLAARLAWAPRELLEALLSAAVALAGVGPAPGAGGGEAAFFPGGAWPAALRAEGATTLFRDGGGARVEALAARLALRCAGAPLRALGAAAEAAGARAEALDALARSAPEELLDPLLNTLLWDPVRAGAGAGARVYDRASITQQLLTDPRDPFTKLPLREEDLQPLPELAARVEAWVRQQLGEEEGANNT